MIYGSSRIQKISVTSVPGAVEGPCGPQGPAGPTGPTGPQGSIGPTGATGFGISGASGFGTTIIFYGQTLAFTFENLGGNSGISSANVYYTIISETPNQNRLSASIVNSGNIFYGQNLKFKGIQIVGSSPDGITSTFVSITSDAQRIYIYGATLSDNQFVIGNTGELFFISDGLGFIESGIKAGPAKNTKWVPSEKQLIIDQLASREPIYNNKNWNAVGTVPYGYGNNDLNFYIGYTGNAFGTSVLENITSPELDSTSAGNFNFTEDALSNNILSTRQVISIGFDLGNTMESISFLPTSSIGYQHTYSPQDLTRDNIGSCCYCRAPAEGQQPQRICLDYVSKSYCSTISGRFDTRSCLTRPSSSDCFIEGACCLYDTDTGSVKCVNTTSERCAQFGGKFNESKFCNIVWVNNELFTCGKTFCNFTKQLGKCCINGRCFNLSGSDCNSIAGAVFVEGTTCEKEDGDRTCCSISYNLVGACCRNGDCFDGVLPSGCTDGIYQGPGTVCRTVNCCGFSFSDDYFKGASSGIANACKAYDSQLYSCIPPGTKLGGGYFVGFVGMPNPCNSFVDPLLAYGEPLECLCKPRGTLQSIPRWPLKSCKGGDGSDNSGSIYYFARTYPKNLPITSLDSKCLVKAGPPIIQQAFSIDEVTWPSQNMFYGGFAYNPAKTYSYSLVDSGLAVEYMNRENNLYSYLSSQVYGENSIHVLWALIVAPEDIEIGSSEGGTTGSNRLLSWGMMQGAHIGTPGSGVPVPGTLVTEEVPTYPLDGLLTTRIHDGSSRNNPYLWFRATGSDPSAFRRFSFGNGNAWGSDITETSITANVNAFKQAYSAMWTRNNPTHSAIYQITNINSLGLYGHNDWYIPSITELNYIFGNLEEINAGLAVNGDQIIGGSEYWSSTSISRLISWDFADPLNKNQYAIEPINSQLEPYLASNRIKSSDEPGSANYNLDEDTAYKFTMAVSNGQKMLTQVFDADQGPNTIGMVRSRFRNARVAQLRPVRRIPLVVTCSGFYYNYNMINKYWQSGSTGCASCLDWVEGICPNE